MKNFLKDVIFSRFGSGETLALAAVLLFIGMLPRIIFPDRIISPNGVDEGIQIMAGRMMSYGFDLYSQINSAQPPIMLTLYGMVETSPSLFRVLSALSSMVIISLIMYASGRAGGWKAMVAAGCFLLLDPMFLLESRLASLDMFSLLWSVLGVWALIMYRDSGRGSFLLVSGALLGTSAMIKLFGGITFGAVGIVLLLDLLKDRGFIRRLPLPAKGDHRTRLSHLALFGLSFALVVLSVMLVFGTREVFTGIFLNQMHRPLSSLEFRLGQFLKYLLPMVATLIFFVMGIGDLYRRREGVAVIIGAVFFIYFLVQAMTFDHHLIFLSPVLALGAGFGIKRFSERYRLRFRKAVRFMPAIMIIAASSLGSGMILKVARSGDPLQEQVAEVVVELTEENDFVISGDPLIPAMADRPVPPSVVNVAHIQYPTLTSDQLNETVVDYAVKCVIITYRLAEMEGFLEFLGTHFELRYHLKSQEEGAEEKDHYSVYQIRDDSLLLDLPDWGSHLEV